MAITTCPQCGALYEERSEEEANSPDRSCMRCAGRHAVSLPDSLQLEMRRARDLLVEYAKIGNAGLFGRLVIADAIQRAERAAFEGDAAAMVRSLSELKELA